jgi:hypothetical protein
LITIEVDLECRFVARSLSGRGPKGESDTPITAESKITDLLRRLELIRRSDSSMLAIGVELDYRSITRSLSGWGPKGELNSLIATESKVMYFLRRRRSCSCFSGLL